METKSRSVSGFNIFGTSGPSMLLPSCLHVLAERESSVVSAGSILRSLLGSRIYKFEKVMNTSDSVLRVSLK